MSNSVLFREPLEECKDIPREDWCAGPEEGEVAGLYRSLKKSFRPRTRGEAWETLPAALHDIRAVIEGSRSLLDLPDNWDEEGALAIREITWRRAADFLARHATWVWDHYGTVIDVPDITPGPDGSIDLDWDYPHYRMLINIPSDPARMAGFYGDDRGHTFMKGAFDPAHLNKGLLDWLSRTA